MDKIDRKILKILSENSATPASEIVPLVNLSIPAINKRIQKLRESGVIRQFSVLVEPEAVGKPICAYILVVIQQGADPEVLMDYIHSDPDILDCAGVTGEYDYLLKVCAANVPALQKKITYLKKAAGVVKSHTMLSLAQYKHSVTALPDELIEKKDV